MRWLAIGADVLLILAPLATLVICWAALWGVHCLERILVELMLMNHRGGKVSAEILRRLPKDNT